MASIKNYFHKEVLKFYTDTELPTFEVMDSMETELCTILVYNK